MPVRGCLLVCVHACVSMQACEVFLLSLCGCGCSMRCLGQKWCVNVSVHELVCAFRLKKHGLMD